MQINKTDVLWNYLATFLRIAASALLLPFILRMMPTEMVGIWTVFMTITAITTILDFGFSPSFTRNITYIFSGVSTLKVNGFEVVKCENSPIDYGLLKSVINTMKWLYLRTAFFLFILLSTLGTIYIHSLLKNYSGDHRQVYIAWIILIFINSYNLFTLYYDSLIQGAGQIRRSKQIIIIGQIVYLAISSFCLIAGYGLIAIVAAQAFSVIIVRYLSYRSFFTTEIIQKLENVLPRSKDEVLKAIFPNSIKIGLTSLGGLMVQRSAIIIGSMYLTLEEIASYGITMQIISVIAALSGIYTLTYLPKISQLRVAQKEEIIKHIYVKGQYFLILTFFLGSSVLILWGGTLLDIINSKTQLLPIQLTVLAIIICFLESNKGISANILLSKNVVPFFKASLISGFFIVLGLLFSFNYLNLGLLTILIVPLLVDLFYQSWKWPIEVIKDLKISVNDVLIAFPHTSKEEK